MDPYRENKTKKKESLKKVADMMSRQRSRISLLEISTINTKEFYEEKNGLYLHLPLDATNLADKFLLLRRVCTNKSTPWLLLGSK